MRTAKLKLAAVVLAATGLVGLGAVGTVYALTQIPAPRTAGEPPPKEAPQPPAKGEPQPQPKQKVPEGDFTAFPTLPPFDPLNDKDYAEKVRKLCPRLRGDDPPPAEPGDDTYRKLLKARLQQGRLELQKMHSAIKIGQWDTHGYVELVECLTDMRNVGLELWGNDPKTLIPWLEEFVVAEKEAERFVAGLVAAGRLVPHRLNAAKRHRLEAEAVLWKAKQRG